MQASDLSSDDKLASSTGYVSRKAANCSLAGRSRGVLGTRRPEKHSCKQCEQLSARHLSGTCLLESLVYT